MSQETETFAGFVEPQANWSKLPHALIEAMPLIETVGEMKVIMYILRHTWGYHDTEKKITLDEFEHGRKRRDGSRIDGGTGLSRPTVINGLQRAVKHGFIRVETDERDKARIKKTYSLRSKDFTPAVKKLDTRGKVSLPRSEKETIERNKERSLPSSEPSVIDSSEVSEPDDLTSIQWSDGSGSKMETSTPRTTDPIEFAAILAGEMDAGDGSWTVTGPEGANPYTPCLVAFCKVIKRPLASLGERKRGNWLRQFEKIGTDERVTPEMMTRAIKRLPKEHEWEFKNRKWMSPFPRSFGEAVGLLAHQIEGGYVGKRIVLRND